MGKKPLATLKQTRKSYMVEYGCGVLLLLLLAFSFLKGVTFPAGINYLVGGLGVFAFASAEVARLLTRYKVMDDKLVIIKGFIKQSKKSIYFHPLGFVPDINVKQSRIERLLNFGTIFIKEGNTTALEIKNINRPHKIMDLIEERIEANRSVTTMHQEGT